MKRIWLYTFGWVGGSYFFLNGLLMGGAAEALKPAGSPLGDSRCLSTGWAIPGEGYCDQPYIVQTDDGVWLCVMTTGPGIEGAAGQHIISMRSRDHGRTWSPALPLEPSDGPEASYAVLLKVPYGRIYCFYNHNTDKVREVKREDGGTYRRVDSLGHYVFKFSDDHGRSWSTRRYEVPVRQFVCDRTNVYGGKLRFFWNVGRPLIQGDTALLVLHKVGAMGAGFFAQSEGVFLRSENILTERDPSKVTFETLPEGEVGLRAPAGGGRIAEEQSVVALSDGSLYCVYRTVDGWPACAYSRDGGRHWTSPEYARYTPGGPRIKHPRAANFVWRCANGQFLYWFHNQGGAAVRSNKTWNPYEDRNPAWLAAGIERDTPQGKILCWSQPEILLYDDDPAVRISYPDLVEAGGKFFVTETQKSLGRVHEIAPALIEGLFQQWDNRRVATNGLALELAAAPEPPSEVPWPKLPALNQRDNSRVGMSLDFWLQLGSLIPGQTLLDNRDENGKGFRVSTTEAGEIRITLNDGRQEASWPCDREVIQPGKLHHVTIIVDAGPKLILFVVDGVLCDGGNQRQFGWGRFSPTLREVNGLPKLKIGPAIRSLRLYRRALYTSEAVGNFRAGF